MPNGGKYTENEHFIPKTYLRGFTDNSGRLWYWDIKNNKTSKSAVKVNDICREKNLYEFRDKDGHIILQNQLENLLGKLENRFNVQRDKLISLSKIDENYKTKCFLNRHEKNFWLLYVAIQILRLPKIIDLCYETGIEMLDGIEEYEAYNIARRICIPFIAIANDNTTEARLIYWLVERMADMNIAVGVSEQKEFITSDNPVCVSGERNDGIIREINFPLTAHMCLFLFRENSDRFGGKNKLIRLTDEAVIAYNKQIIYGADEKIFSKSSFDDEMIATIKNVRTDREIDYSREG